VKIKRNKGINKHMSKLELGESVEVVLTTASPQDNDIRTTGLVYGRIPIIPDNGMTYLVKLLKFVGKPKLRVRKVSLIKYHGKLKATVNKIQ
jgi:hypothetical protein